MKNTTIRLASTFTLTIEHDSQGGAGCRPFGSPATPLRLATGSGISHTCKHPTLTPVTHPSLSLCLSASPLQQRRR
ncbi:hypothetical protein HanIR_Chr09g0422061 [Helianthus annuus]|nr:hypothetical protein HanIR_Chr09g0422061 [Helianthus annuus]